jgi:transcription-repair coupling factor (superfamily II helicase)
LPQKALVLIDDLSVVEGMVAEVEEQAVKLRNESIQEETLLPDFPLPYITWPDLLDNFQTRPFLELGYSTQLDGELGSQENLASGFSHDERFGGRLKSFVDYLASLVEKARERFVISRQSHRLHELWLDVMRRTGNEVPEIPLINPQFIEASLSEGFT